MGSDFLDLVSPITFDNKAMKFICFINGMKIVFPMFFEGIYKCNKRRPKSIRSLKYLYKIECVVVFADMHGDKAIKDLSEKFVADCCSDHPNAFWTCKQTS